MNHKVKLNLLIPLAFWIKFIAATVQIEHLPLPYFATLSLLKESLSMWIVIVEEGMHFIEYLWIFQVILLLVRAVS
jgi:hypothetical protein